MEPKANHSHAFAPYLAPRYDPRALRPHMPGGLIVENSAEHDAMESYRKLDATIIAP